MTRTCDVAVVGGGLAGLACARELHGRGLDVLVLESADEVGGRVRTDQVDGFTLDRGFQVLNTGYPELRRTVDLEALDLQAFASTVALHVNGRQVDLGNPLQDPGSLAGALGMPVGGVLGKAALGVYAGLCASLPAGVLKHRKDVSAAEAWRQANVPTAIVNGVLRPFFSGVLLEQEMSTSRRFTDLMMRMFARGRSTVPAGGMQALPRQLAAALPDDCVRTASPVQRVAQDRVVLDDGTTVTARAVVVATDVWTAATLVPALRPTPRALGVTTVYHAAEPWPEQSASLVLDAETSPIANSVVISAAAPGHAPAGASLVSTSIVHGSVPDDLDGADVRAALSRLHGTDTSRWQHLATYSLPRALPAMTAPHRLRKPVRLRGGGQTMYVAGDHRDTSSIQGALVSGRRAATAVAHDLLGPAS